MQEEWPAPLGKSGRQPGIEADTTRAIDTRFLSIMQRHFTIGFNGLRNRHYKFIWSKNVWYRWTPQSNEWQPVSFAEVYDCLVFTLAENNCYPPWWLLRSIENEARLNPDTSSDNYWGLYNSPEIASPTFHTKKYIARGFTRDC